MAMFFRSDGQWINVNEMMKSFGGGGYAAAAGLAETGSAGSIAEQLLRQIESIQSLSDDINRHFTYSE